MLYLSNGIHARHSDRPFVKTFSINTAHTKELQEKIVATANKVLNLFETHKEQQALLHRALRYLKHANKTADLKEAEAFTTLAHALTKAVEGTDPFYASLLKEKDFLSDFKTAEDYKKNIEQVIELAEMFDAYQELFDLVYKNDAGGAQQPGNNQIPSNNNQQPDPNHDPNDPLSPGLRKVFY